MRMRWTALLVIVCCLVLGCSAGDAATTAAAQRDNALMAQRNAWHERQAAMDCVAPPYENTAIEAVLRAHRDDRAQRKHGPVDPYKRLADSIENIKTRPNPRGEGVIVTAWKDNNPRGSADYSRRRSAWLVLDRTVYPINVTAAGDIGLLYDGVPAAIQKRAGLTHTFERGKTMMDQLGLEDFTSERRFSGGNPFPMCR